MDHLKITTISGDHVHIALYANPGASMHDRQSGFVDIPETGTRISIARNRLPAFAAWATKTLILAQGCSAAEFTELVHEKLRT